MLQILEERFPCRVPWWSRWIFSEGAVACGGATVEQVYLVGLQPVDKALS